MLSKAANPALSSLPAVLAASGLRLAVKSVEKRKPNATALKLAA